MNGNKSGNIFVTGASGFLGRHFLEVAYGHDYRINILTRNRSELLKDPFYSRLEIHEGSLEEIDKLKSVISSCNFFIHMAGEKRNEEKMEEVNLFAMKKIVDIINENPQTALMYISSCGVYGIESHPRTLIDESMDCFPVNSYEKTKLEAENCLRLNAKFRYVILRPSNVFGEYDKTEKLLNLMRTLRKKMFFYSDQDAKINYVYVKYVASVMWYFIKTGKFNNETYNVNSPIELKSFIQILKQELNVFSTIRKIPFGLLRMLASFMEMLPKKVRVFDSRKLLELTNKKIYSNAKLEAEMNTSGQKFLVQGLKNLVSWYRQQGKI